MGLFFPAYFLQQPSIPIKTIINQTCICFLAGCLIACGPEPEDNFDAKLSHGALPLDLREKLENPQATYNEILEKYERARSRRLELEKRLLESPSAPSSSENENFQQKTNPSFPDQSKVNSWTFKTLKKYIQIADFNRPLLQAGFFSTTAQAQESQTSSLLQTNLKVRIEQWALASNQALEDGSLACRALVKYWCQYKIRSYKQQAFDWIEQTASFRVTLRMRGQGLKDQLAKDGGRSVDLSQSFFNILDDLEIHDLSVKQAMIQRTIDNEIWPELPYEEKIERWASDALRTLDARTSNLSLVSLFFDPGNWTLENINFLYSDLIEKDRVDLLEWVSLDSSQRHQIRVEHRANGDMSPDASAHLYDRDESLRAIYDFIAALDELDERQRQEEIVERYARLSPWERQDEEQQADLDFVKSPDLLRRIQEIHQADQQIQAQLDQQAVNWWRRLGYERRIQRRNRGSGLRDRWDVSVLDDVLLAQLHEIERQDRQTYNNLARQAIDVWASRTSRERINGEDIRNEWDLSQLEESLIAQIQTTEHQDIQFRFEQLSNQIAQIENLSFDEREIKRQTDDNLLYDWHTHQRDQWFPQDVFLRYEDVAYPLAQQLTARMEGLEHLDQETKTQRLVEANNEKFMAWAILPLAERIRQRELGQGIETQLDSDHITEELRTRIVHLEDRDQQLQNRIVASRSEETFEQWDSLSLEEKQRRTASGEGIESLLDPTSISTDLRERIRASVERDNRERARLIVEDNTKKFEQWALLPLIERERQDSMGEGIENQLDQFHIPRHLRERINRQRERDNEARDQLARNLLTRVRSDMPYLGRLEAVRFHELEIRSLREQINEYKLSNDLWDELRNLENLIISARNNADLLAPQYASREESRQAFLAFYQCDGPLASDIERCQTPENLGNQWSQARAEEHRYEDALRRYERANLSEYETARVKIYPISCTGSRDPQYRGTCRDGRDGYSSRTCQTNLTSFQFYTRNRGEMRLEIHSSDESGQGMMFADGVTQIHLEIPDRYDLNSDNNLIRYRFQDESEGVYLLKNLSDYSGTQRLQTIRVIPQNSSFTHLRWRGGRQSRTGRGRFRGSFRIQASINDRYGKSEWSVINDVPIDQYTMSSVPSEMPVNSANEESLMAQSVLVQSYLINVALYARKVEGREWDILPTECSQAYRGADEETAKSTRAVRATEGLVLAHRGLPAFTEYHASWTGETNRTTRRIMQPRIVPNGFEASERWGKLGHGNGMPQRATMSLTQEGWTGTNRPSTNAIVPSDIYRAWSYIEALLYWYEDVELANWRTLSL